MNAFIDLDIQDEPTPFECAYNFYPGESAITHRKPEDCHEVFADVIEPVGLKLNDVDMTELLEIGNVYSRAKEEIRKHIEKERLKGEQLCAA